MQTDRAARTAWLRMPAVVVTACYVAQVAWLAATAVQPGLRQSVPGWAAALAEPGSLPAMSLTVGLAIAAFILVVAAARGWTTGRRLPLLVSAWSATTAAPLAFLGYLPCPEDGPPVWEAINSTLSLFFGSFEKPFGPGEACVYPTPLGMHVARGFALLATASGAISVLLTVSRSQLDRLSVYRARSLTVVAGLDGPSWELVDHLAVERSAGHRTVLLTSGPDPAVVERARAARLLVLRTDPDDLLGLREGVRPARVDRVYLLAGDDTLNRARAAALRALLRTADRPADAGPLTVGARSDDPWHADEWRKSLVGDPLVAADAVGLYEATSSSLLGTLRRQPTRTLLIVGDGPLTLALCAELSQLGRELRFLGDAAALPAVTVLCPRASELVDDHRVLQRRFASDPLTVTAVDAEATLPAVLDLIGQSPDPAVVITQRDTRLGTQLGIRLPALRVFELAAGSDVATPEVTTVGSVVSFGLSLAAPEGDEDAWERAARLIHERYRRRYPQARLAVPWDKLPEFYRQSNRRQLGVVRRGLAALGRTWSPTRAETVEFDESRLEAAEPDLVITEGIALFDLTEDELSSLAKVEHESWVRHNRAAGWTPPATRDDNAKRHPDLLAWSELPAQRRRSAMAGVVDTLLQLRALGHRAVRPVADPGGWRRFQRVGEVTALRLTERHAWRAPTGEELTGRPGDWLVTDASGRKRTVTDASFRVSHRHLADDRWERTSQMEARPARPGEVVQTQEGVTTAGEDGWVVRDAEQNYWIVPEEQFRAGYRPL